MPTFNEDLATVKELRAKQSALNMGAAQDTSYAKVFGDNVWDKVRAARAERGISMMQQGVGDTMSQLATDPADIRERTGADVNPLAVDALTARARGQNLSTLGTLAAFEQDTTNTIEGAIGAQTNQLLAKAAMKEAEAKQAKAESDALIEQIQLQMEREKLELEKATKGSGNEKYYVDIPGVGKVALSGAEVLAWQKEQNKSNPNMVELKSGQQKDMNFYKDMYKAAQEAEGSVKDEYTGVWDYLKGNVRGVTGKSTLDETGYRLNKDAVNTAIRNKISGTAVSAEEKKTLEGLQISVIDSDAKVKQKLAKLKDYALNGAGSILSTSGYESIDAMDYFMRDMQINKSTRPPLSSFDK